MAEIVVRVLKVPEYRLGLFDAERARLHANPSGIIEVTEADLSNAVDGTWKSTKS